MAVFRLICVPVSFNSYRLIFESRNRDLHNHRRINYRPNNRNSIITSRDLGTVTGISFINPDERSTMSLANGSLPFEPHTGRKCFLVNDA